MWGEDINTTDTSKYADNEKVEETEQPSVRVLQWNHLSQTLGTKGDKFVQCDPAALNWSVRYTCITHVADT